VDDRVAQLSQALVGPGAAQACKVPTAFTAGVGTGGTVMGVGQYQPNRLYCCH